MKYIIGLIIQNSESKSIAKQIQSILIIHCM